MGSGLTQSEQALVETPSVASAPSVEVTRVNEESTKLNVSWQKPDNAAFIPEIIAYDVERSVVDAEGNAVTSIPRKSWTFTYQNGIWKATSGERLDVSGEKFAFVDESVAAQEEIYGCSYVYTVKGRNEVGSGQAGEGKYTFQPLAPTGLKQTPGTNQTKQLTIQWDASKNNGNEPIVKYNVYRDGEKVGEVAYNAALTTYQYTDTGLTSGEAYAYSVSAESANGEGPACEAVTIRPNGLAGQPTQIGGETTGASSAYVTWTAPSQINGVKPNGEDLEVTGYVVSWRVSGSEEVAGSATLYVKEQGGVYIPVTAGGEPAVQNADGVYELVLSPGTSGVQPGPEPGLHIQI